MVALCRLSQQSDQRSAITHPMWKYSRNKKVGKIIPRLPEHSFHIRLQSLSPYSSEVTVGDKQRPCGTQTIIPGRSAPGQP